MYSGPSVYTLVIAVFIYLRCHQHFCSEDQIASLSSYPRQILFTLIAFEAHSLLIAFVICSTPPFVQAYAAILIFAINEIIDAMFMIFPDLFSSSNLFPTSCAATKDALRLIEKTYKASATEHLSDAFENSRHKYPHPESPQPSSCD